MSTLLIPDPDGLAQCLSKTMRPDSWIRNNEKKPQASSLKHQASSACDILSRVISLLDMNCHNIAIIVIYNIWVFWASWICGDSILTSSL